FFFFQAEDGIRDLSVTGVQTCALPISGSVLRHRIILNFGASSNGIENLLKYRLGSFPIGMSVKIQDDAMAQDGASHGTHIVNAQIGRASCRERRKHDVGAILFKKQKKK